MFESQTLPQPGNVPCVPLQYTTTSGMFRVVGDEASLFFIPGNDRLVVTFDNLASIDEPYPRLPWLARHVVEPGYSLLGIQSHAKDWFRQEDAPNMIRELQDQGFFAEFQKIVFIGASMGGFGALNFAPLVPRARVLAFSPQSSMNKTVAPFEGRFTWAVRNSNWDGMPFLDAAAAIPYLPSATIVYDPFVPEDRMHAQRLAGPRVEQCKLGHASHEAVRLVIKAGAMADAVRQFTEKGHLGSPEFWQKMRDRRAQRKWCRALVTAARNSHPRLTLDAAEGLFQKRNYLFAKQARDDILREFPELLQRSD